MVSRRSRNEDQVPATRVLVPASPASPVGILDVSTLQLLLSPLDAAACRQPPPSDRDGDRPASSELARAYGVSHDDATHQFNRARRRVVVQTKRQRRPVPSKLEPMETPHPCRREDRPQHDEAVPQDASRKQRENPRLARKNRTGNRFALSISTNETNPKQRISLNAAGGKQDGDELRRELQWIHAHFPVLRLVNPRCSLALRRQLFVGTIAKNVARGALRLAWRQWHWTIVQQKQVEASKLKAFGRMVAMFDHAARDHVFHRWGVWVRYVEGCRETERLAAAVAIQEWYVWCRQRREGRASLLALSIEQALATANAKATSIQRRVRVFIAQQHLRYALESITRIQRCVRASKRRRLLADQQAAAKKLDELLSRMRHTQQLAMLTMKRHDRQARKIADAWRQYAAWRAQVVHEAVERLVDEVEFCGAVLSIQRHLRGYQCRIRLRRKARASALIQHAWRRYTARRRARAYRNMLLLTYARAASCLQRTFRQNRQRKKHRAVMAASTRPMFLRACGASTSFRKQFHVQIVKSAVAVIQSTWRRHVVYKRWMLARDVAARRIQRWQRVVWTLSTWKCIGRSAMTLHQEQRRHYAARCLQRWLGHRLKEKRALATRQVLALLTAVIAIQRYYRRKKDPWRRLLQSVIQGQLPQYRISATIIQKCWRGYANKKRRLLALYDGGADLPCGLGLHGLQHYLICRKLELERRIQSAQTIQKAYRQRLARQDGKVLLKKYRLLFQREIRRRQQRRVIHGYLAERQDERSRTLQSRAPSSVSPVRPSSPSTPASSAVSPTPSADTQTNWTDRNGELTTTSTVSMRDNPDVVECWSDEHQSHYWFNTRTGESAWCG